MCIWAGAGSVALWAVDVAVNSSLVIFDSNGEPLPVLEVYVRPAVITSSPDRFVIRDIKRISEIPADATISVGGYYCTYLGLENNVGGYNYYFQYNPANDRMYVARALSGRGRDIVTYFQNSSVYQVLRWPYEIKGAVDPDLEGVQEKVTGGMLPMLLLLLGCGIGLKLLDYGSIKLMRFWDDKDSQRALARINNIEDPLEHKVALEAHRKAYNARFKRYAKEDRQRRRR